MPSSIPRPRPNLQDPHRRPFVRDQLEQPREALVAQVGEDLGVGRVGEAGSFRFRLRTICASRFKFVPGRNITPVVVAVAVEDESQRVRLPPEDGGEVPRYDGVDR
jgi:hypothetical protein